MNGLTRGTIVTRYLWTYRKEISAEHGLLFEGHSLIFPEKLRNRTLQTIHRGHCCFDKMQLRAREFVFRAKLQSCNVRQTFSKSQQRETLMPHEVPQGPWENLATDFFEFHSNSYLLIADFLQQVSSHQESM